jgi:adenine/guanine phosphoribosyltransferase-like PRPP-binding protein
MNHVFTDYLEDVFTPELFQRMVPRAIDMAKEILEAYPYDAIAFSGTSGCAIGFILGYSLNIPIVCIRKPDQETHYKNWADEDQRMFEGFHTPKRYLIVDDGICSGRTVERIMESININCGTCRCVAVLLFNQVFHSKTYFPKDKTLAKMYDHGISVYSCKRYPYQEPK